MLYWLLCVRHPREGPAQGGDVIGLACRPLRQRPSLEVHSLQKTPRRGGRSGAGGWSGPGKGVGFAKLITSWPRQAVLLPVTNTRGGDPRLTVVGWGWGAGGPRPMEGRHISSSALFPIHPHALPAGAACAPSRPIPDTHACALHARACSRSRSVLPVAASPSPSSDCCRWRRPNRSMAAKAAAGQGPRSRRAASTARTCSRPPRHGGGASGQHRQSCVYNTLCTVYCVRGACGVPVVRAGACGVQQCAV